MVTEPELSFNRKVEKEHDEYASRIMRAIFIKPVAKILLRYTNITPNQITILSILPGVTGIFFLVWGGYKFTIIGAFLVFLYGMMDGLDGIIARARNMGSNFGAWLDGVIGFVFFPFFLLALAVGLRDYKALIIGCVAALGFPIQFNIINFFKLEILQNKERLQISDSGKFNFLRYVYGYALFYPLLVVGALFNSTFYVLFLFAVLALLGWVFVIFLQYNNIRKHP